MVANLEVDQQVSDSSVTFYWEWDDNLNKPYASSPVKGIFRGFKVTTCTLIHVLDFLKSVAQLVYIHNVKF